MKVPVFKRGTNRRRWHFFGIGEVRRPVEGKDYVQVMVYPFYMIPYGGMQP